MFVNAGLAVMLVGAGMVLEHVRAQSASPLADVKFSHIGFVTRDIDASIKAWSSAIGMGHTPLRDVTNLPLPSRYDPKGVLRISEIVMNGVEVHLMQPVRGTSPWREHLDTHGEGSLHHLAFLAKDVEAVRDGLVKRGGTVTLGDGRNPGAVYVTLPPLPFVIELNRMP